MTEMLRTQSIRRLLFGLLLIIGFGRTLYAQNGQLIVFMDASETVVNADFSKNWLPKIKEMGAAQGIEVLEMDISKGAPELVKATPSIFFQNALGRSAYIGRYQLIDKLKTFIRTVSRMPQQAATNEKHDVLVWKQGRATVYCPIKITELAGAKPKNFDQEKFTKDAFKALDRVSKEFEFYSIFPAQRSDRAMYWALYPYLGEDGKFFLSAEMYSQFNCVEPIYKRFDNAFSGNWKNWEAVFEEAGQTMEKMVAEKLRATDKGDGMIPVPSSIKSKNWEELGLPLPKPVAGTATQAVKVVDLAQNWTFAGPIGDGTPVLGFSFLAPLDYYAGEIDRLFGDLYLNKEKDLNAATGSFGVEMEALSMGDPSLDAHVHEMLDILEFPKAYFTFQKILSAESPLIHFGNVSQFVVAGELNFMGIKAPLEVISQIEPILNDAGEARLQVLASFSLRLKDKFGIKGPDGPEPASDTMQFLMNFLLQPKL